MIAIIIIIMALSWSSLQSSKLNQEIFSFGETF